MSRFLAGIIFAITSASAVAADQISVDAKLSAPQIYQGESVTFEIQIRGLKEGGDARPDMSKFAEQFDFAETEHGWTGRSEQVTIINGKVTRNVDPGMLLYRFRLTPKKTGRLILPQAAVSVEGKTFQTPVTSMNVTAPEKQDVAIIEILTSHERVFPMKAFTVTLKILLKPIPGDPQDPVTVLPNPPALLINWKDPAAGLKAGEDLKVWLERLLSRSGRGFTINDVTNDPFGRLAVFTLNKGREKRAGADGAELNYYLYELTRTFIAQRPGSYKFGAATIKGVFADGYEAGGKRLAGRSLLAVAPEKVVVCDEFPEPKPENFSGAIGQFKLQASTPSRDMRVGDPLTLKLDFVRAASENSSPLEDIAALNISSNAQIAADFSIVEQATSGQIKGGTKTFTYVLRPKKSGVTIPAISATVFNPDSGKYEEIVSAPIALNVTDAPQLRPDELVSSSPMQSSQKISGRDKGVFQNISDMREVSKAALKPMIYLLAVAGMWICFAVFATLLKIRRARAGDTVWQNRQRAESEAAANMNAAREALGKGDAAGASQSVRRALTSAIGRRSGIEPAGMTAQDAATLLEKSKVNPEARGQITDILEQIEASKYGSSSSGQAEAQVSAAEKLIPILRKEMDAGA